MSSEETAAARRSDRIVMGSNIPVLDTGMFDHMGRIAKLMAASGLVPSHLNAFKKEGGQDIPMSQDEAVANCFLVVNQAIRWRMDPFAVAQGVFVLRGKVGYEGKLIAAVINSHPLLAGRLSYKYDGEGQSRAVTVSGQIKDEQEAKTISGTVAQWKTANDSWIKIPDQMLAYRGAREWARRHMPEAILGVYAEEELEFEQQPRTIQGEVVPERSAGAAMRAALVDGSKPASPEQGQRDLEALRDAVVFACGKLAEHKDAETMTLFAETLDERVRADEEFTRAFHKRLAELKAGPGPSTALPGSGELPLGKQPGTPRLRKQFVEKIQKADKDTVDVVLDETRLYLWSNEDAFAIKEAGDARRAALASGG